MGKDTESVKKACRVEETEDSRRRKVWVIRLADGCPFMTWSCGGERQARERAEQFNEFWEQMGGPELLEACQAGLAERTNIGLARPFWTPGLTEQLRGAIANTEGNA